MRICRCCSASFTEIEAGTDPNLCSFCEGEWRRSAAFARVQGGQVGREHALGQFAEGGGCAHALPAFYVHPEPSSSIGGGT